jgi:hypothetical protein
MAKHCELTDHTTFTHFKLDQYCYGDMTGINNIHAHKSIDGETRSKSYGSP